MSEHWFHILNKKMKAIDENHDIQFNSLSDAGPDYAPGKTQIWYCKDTHFRDFSMGPEFVIQKGLLSLEALSATHVLVGTLNETDPEQIFMLMQGESWSPHGEARGMIERLETHTSMSVGDIVISDAPYMVDRMGFFNLKSNKRA